MPSLFPVFDLPTEGLVDESKDKNAFMPSVAFDFEKGDFVRNGANKLIMSDGYLAWKNWCVKAVMTQRYECFCYDSDYGAETNAAFAEPARKSQESALIRTVTETLLADPAKRTLYVRNFSFNWNIDSVLMTCEVLAKDGTRAAISIPLQGER